MNKKRPDFVTSNTYSTTVTKGMKGKMDSIGLELEKVIILNGTDSDALKVEDNELVIVKGEIPNLGAFAHPFYHNDKVFIDARAYVNRQGGIKDSTEYHFLRRRGILEINWAEDRVEWASQADLVTDVFASWLADCVTRRMNMSMLENQQLRILAAIYYLHFLHRHLNVNTEDTFTTILKVVPRLLRVPATTVQDLAATVGEERLANLYSYKGLETPAAWQYLDEVCNLFNDLTDNAYKLSTALINQCCVRGAFICANAPEITAIAIQHPPVMFLMIWYCGGKGFYNKTGIGMKVQALGKKHGIDKFNHFMASIFNGETI